jgi:hypothetical protein
MIRIFVDEPDGIELIVRQAEVELYPSAARPSAQDISRPQTRRRGVGLVMAALLVVASGGAGYFMAPRTSPARAGGIAAAQFPSAESRRPPHPPAEAAAALRSPQAVIDSLSTEPSITPPAPPARSAAPPGVAAFGLQP